MITLHIGKYLEVNGFGTLDITGSIKSNGIYTEFLDTGKTGITLYSRGSSIERGKRIVQAFDIYSRGTNNAQGYQVLESVIEFIENSYNDQCSLPTPIMMGATTLSNKKYNKIVIETISNIENVGADATNRVIYSATFTIQYETVI